MPYYRLTTLRVYQDDTATFTFEIADPTVVNWNQTSTSVYKCSLTDENQVKFELHGSEVAQVGGLSALPFVIFLKICSANVLIASLQSGKRVRYVTEYAKCFFEGEEGMGATGGSSLHTYYDIDSTNEGQLVTLELQDPLLIHSFCRR